MLVFKVSDVFRDLGNVISIAGSIISVWLSVLITSVLVVWSNSNSGQYSNCTFLFSSMYLRIANLQVLGITSSPALS